MNTPSETDLHALIDGELAADARQPIADWLATDPAAAARAADYQAQKAALQQCFGPIAEETPPPQLLALCAAPPRRWLPGWSLQRLVAGLAIILGSATLGWFAHSLYRPVPLLAQQTTLPQQAAMAHLVYSPDVRRPVEISAEQEAQLVTWLSKRLGTPVKPPSLGKLGFELIGGRLLPGSSGPVAQFMYQDTSGQRLTLYLSRENSSKHDTAFRFAEEGKINVFYWIDGQFGYALSGSIAKSQLAEVAKLVYDQLDGR